jgi:hypothetical protein
MIDRTVIDFHIVLYISDFALTLIVPLVTCSRARANELCLSHPSMSKDRTKNDPRGNRVARSQRWPGR